MTRKRIPELVSEIKDQLESLDRLAREIGEVEKQKPSDDAGAKVYEESLALKLHNFYTGCERIFQHIAYDLNGTVPESSDWHKRLLHAMSLEIEDVRPAVLSKSTAARLQEFLAFRHVVRNIYSFELDSARVSALVQKVGPTFNELRRDIEEFLQFLRQV